MSIRLIVFNLLIEILITLFTNTSEECLCNTRLNGEYCGSELNRRNGNNDCETNIYYCGRSNRNKTAILLAKCVHQLQCNQNTFRRSSRVRRRNQCMRQFKCQCPQQIGRGPHCGSKLIGDDCPSNILFTCRYVSDNVSARDACPEGCLDDKCIHSIDGDIEDIDNNRMESNRESSDESDTEP